MDGDVLAVGTAGLDAAVLGDMWLRFCKRVRAAAATEGEAAFGNMSVGYAKGEVVETEFGRMVVVSLGGLGAGAGIGWAPCGLCLKRMLILASFRLGFVSGSGAQVSVGR